MRVLLGVLVALLVIAAVFVAGVLAAPRLTTQLVPASPTPIEQIVVRVNNEDGTLLGARLRQGWEIERRDADGAGTTYFLRRDPSRAPPPTPRPGPSPNVPPAGA